MIVLAGIVFQDDNPLPYVPAFLEWSAHVHTCVQCEHVDQVTSMGEEFEPLDLCEGGAILHLQVERRIREQHMISQRN